MTDELLPLCDDGGGPLSCTPGGAELRLRPKVAELAARFDRPVSVYETADRRRGGGWSCPGVPSFAGNLGRRIVGAATGRDR